MPRRPLTKPSRVPRECLFYRGGSALSVLALLLQSMENACTGLLSLPMKGLEIKAQTGPFGFCAVPCRAAWTHAFLPRRGLVSPKEQAGACSSGGQPGLTRREGCRLEGQNLPESSGASSWDWLASLTPEESSAQSHSRIQRRQDTTCRLYFGCEPKFTK